MDGLKLEPYAVTLHFSFPDIQGRWEELLSRLLIGIAAESTKSGQAVVGHIKTLSLFPDNQYFRMSVIAPGIPPTTEGSIPPGRTELDVTLNVLIYGIARPDLEEITRASADRLAADWKGRIDSET
ncbi:MAG: hypothetical protein JXA25_19350 [Anaerolineales bacterium]|nr:hypothetical protein [Anaerolineales bacterium]